MFCCWCWVGVLPATRQASELMIACAHIWGCRSQAQSHGRQSRAETWLAALQVSFADSYSGNKTMLIFSCCGVYLDNNIVIHHEIVVAVGYSTAQSGTLYKGMWKYLELVPACIWIHWTLTHKIGLLSFGTEETPPMRSHSSLSLKKTNLSANRGPALEQLSLNLSQQCQSRVGGCAELSAVKPSHEEMVRFATQMYFWNTTSL